MIPSRSASGLASILRGTPPSALLLSGSGTALADLAAERLKVRFEEEGASADITRWTAADLDRNSLLTALRSPSFFVRVRIHVLPDIGELKKGPREELLEYLRRPDPDVVLVSSCSKWAALKAFQPLPGVRTFSPSEEQAAGILGEFATAMARGAGKGLGADAAMFLARWLGLDFGAVRSEVGKLIAFAGTRTEIGEEDIRKVCIARGDVDPFRLGEELFRGNAVVCLSLFRDFAKSSGPEDFHRLLGAIGWQARRRAATGKEGKIHPARVLVALARLDRRMKGESGLSPEQLWEIELLGLFAGRRGA